MIFPVRKPYIITQGFHAGHPGIDIAPTDPGRTTRNILSPEATTVFQTGFNPALEGNYYILKGKSKYYYFGHLAKREVATGQKLKEGQSIGIIGETGLATGIHTHHEVRTEPYGGSIDPEAYYKKNVKPKEKKEMVTMNGLTVLYRAFGGRVPTAYAKRNYLNKVTFDEAYNEVRKSARYEEAIKQAKAGTLDAKQHLPTRLREAL